MLDGRVAERAVLGHDAQPVAALLGVSGKTVRTQRVGHRVQRRAERALHGLAGGHSPVGVAHVEIDVTARGIAERRRDGGDGGGELGWRERTTLHTPVSLRLMPLTQAQVVDALRPVQDPELHRSIVELGMVKEVTIAGSDITVQVALTVPGCPLRAEIDQRVTDAIHGLDAGAAVSVDFTVMSEAELRALR